MNDILKKITVPVILACICILAVVNIIYAFQNDLEKTSVIFNNFISPVVTGLSIYLVYMTYMESRKANKELMKSNLHLSFEIESNQIEALFRQIKDTYDKTNGTIENEMYGGEAYYAKLLIQGHGEDNQRRIALLSFATICSQFERFMFEYELFYKKYNNQINDLKIKQLTKSYAKWYSLSVSLIAEDIDGSLFQEKYQVNKIKYINDLNLRLSLFFNKSLKQKGDSKLSLWEQID